MSFRWEEDLRRSFVEHARPSLWSQRKTDARVRTVQESTCSDGRADWVWASVSRSFPEPIPRQIADLLQQRTCSRILSLLKAEAVRSESYLQCKAGVAPPTFRRWLLKLLDLGLVDDLGGGKYVLGRNFSAPEIEICSFEFKLSNWKRALYQAKRYRTFSHRVFVVMPPDSSSLAMDALQIFRKFNIGFIRHDADGSSQRVVPSRKRVPTSRDRFIRALGMLLADAS